MIRSFADTRTEELFCEGTGRKLAPDIVKRAVRKLDMLDAAHDVTDLRVPPGNRLHALRGDREGQFSIAVNDQWRICFRFEDGCAFDVEFCDYH